MDKRKMIEWVGTQDTGISSMTMWCALMDVDGRNGIDADVPHDISDFRRCYHMVEYGKVTGSDLQKVKKQYPWFAPFVDNWRELSLFFEEELDGRLYGNILQLENESERIREKC